MTLVRTASRRLASALLCCLLSVGCTKVEKLEWKPSAVLMYGQEAELHVVIREGWLFSGDLDAVLEEHGPLRVVRKSRRELSAGALELTFGVVPVAVGKDIEAILRYGNRRSSREKFGVSVEMPNFSGRSNGSFVEVADAPDQSIYGAHITFWSNAEARYVSGHAASNVCRRISAAVINYAISRAAINDDFFVGAGFASLPDDRDVAERFKKELLVESHPQALREKLELLIGTPDATAAYDLADILDEPSSYQPRIPGSEHFNEVLMRADLMRDAEEIANWIHDPARALAFLGQRADLDDVIGEIKSLPPNRRAALARSLRRYAAVLESKNLLEREVADTGRRSGLVKKRVERPPAMSVLTPAIRKWGSSARPGAHASLASLGPQAQGASGPIPVELRRPLTGSEDLSLLGRYTGPKGIVFVPFVDLEKGSDISFKLPKAIFAPVANSKSETSTSVLDLVHKAVTKEMISNLEDAAARNREHLREVVELSLPELGADLRKSKTPAEWLRTMKSVTVHYVNEVGERTGKVETRNVSNFDHWKDRIAFAETSRRQANLYEQSARRIREMSEDPKAIAISESVLLDSFLRGWDLSFADNADDSPYRKWLASNRTRVWQEISRAANARGLSLAPLVSEQTVFQVRSDGDAYQVRPMYVGDIGDTTVAKSHDGRMLYYRSPWMQRQVVYVQQSDVGAEAWKSAQSQFDATNPDPALTTLAEDLLARALANEDRQLQIAAIRRAMAVNPEYVANRLIGDYWSLWKEEPRTLAEHATFEQMLEKEELDPRSMDPAMLRKLESYLVTRAFEAGLEVMRCLSATAAAIDKGASDPAERSNSSSSSSESRLAGNADACFDKPQHAERNALSALEIDKAFDQVRTDLRSASENWRFDALGRSLAQASLHEATRRLAAPLVQLRRLTEGEAPAKRAVAADVRLQWYSGEFAASLGTTLAAVAQRAQTPAVWQRASLLADLRMDVLKALVYSGVQIGSAGEPKLASLRPTFYSAVPAGRTTFAIRSSDFAARPVSVDRIAYRIMVSGKATTTTDVRMEPPVYLPESVAPQVPFAADAVRQVIETTAGAQSLGISTTRVGSGFHSTVWTRDGKDTRIVSFSEVTDGRGHSQVVKLGAADPVGRDRSIEALRSNGFEMLQRRELNHDFDRPVVLVYPSEVVMLTGDEALRFSRPASAKTTAIATEAAFKQANIPLVRLEDSGLLGEARRIFDGDLDATGYFGAGNQGFPGVTAFSRDKGELRVLVTDSDGSITSMSFAGKELQRRASGVDAIRDIESLERQSLAAHSDDNVKFVHLSSFENTPGAVARMQVGQATADIPVAEIRAAIEGSPGATPTLDRLFPQVQGGNTPTVVVYRDAVVRSGGGGAGKPPESGPITSSFPDDEPPFDADRHFVAAFHARLEHAPPVPLVLALTRRYPGYRVTLDDTLEIARANALNPVTVRGAKDIGAYLPPRSFGVTAFGAIVNVQRQLTAVGVTVEASLNALAQQNVLVISGHKDHALEAYIEAHMKAGNFRGKQVVLFSCYQRGDANLVHRMINEGGARNVVFFAEEITPRAVNAVVTEMAKTLGAGPGLASETQLIDLIDNSVEAVGKRPEVSEALRKEVDVLRRRVPQISTIMPRGANRVA